MFRILFSCIVLIYSITAFSQAFTAPDSGKTVDESFRVSLLQQLPANCFAWHIKGVELDVLVVIGRSYVEELTTRDARTRAENDTLLSLTQERAKGSSGCVEFAYVEISKYVYTFDAAVITGKAVVLDGRDYSPAPYAVIRYSAQEAFGGHITYAIPSQRPFRVNLWWIR